MTNAEFRKAVVCEKVFVTCSTNVLVLPAVNAAWGENLRPGYEAGLLGVLHSTRPNSCSYAVHADTADIFHS